MFENTDKMNKRQFLNAKIITTRFWELKETNEYLKELGKKFNDFLAPKLIR